MSIVMTPLLPAPQASANCLASFEGH